MMSVHGLSEFLLDRRPSAGRQRAGGQRRKKGEEKCVYTDGKPPGESQGERKSAGSVSAFSNFLLRRRKKRRILFQSGTSVQSRSKHGKTRTQESFALNFFHGERKKNQLGDRR